VCQFFCFSIIADFVARHAWREAVAGFTVRDTVPRTSAVAGRAGLFWGRRERQADRSSAEGHPRFFWQPLSRRSAPRPTIPASSDARSREPYPRANLRGNAPRPSRRPGLRKIAHQVFVEAGSGVLRQDVGIGLGTKMAG
jgi:hypothetical protein